ncbi:TPA: hypothetical protein EYO57_36040, partial [Candidatus Poribacteria bacterium]|nr:hypothetical protein [Candidatus Poribacteria bacterium]
MNNINFFASNKMASLTIQKFQGILVQSDLECEGSIASKHGVFLGNLFITDRHGFKVYRRKNTVPLSVQGFQDSDTSFNVGDADTCVAWYNKMLIEGFVQRIDEIFPVQHLYEDFTEIDYSKEVQSLKTRLDQLDLVNMLDAEFVAALQSGGAAYVEIASQVSAETSARQQEDTGIKSRLDLIEAGDWVTTVRIQNGQVTAAKCAADVASQAELETEKLRLTAIEADN